MSDTSTWPEQDAVENWLNETGVIVDNRTAMRLKEAVSKYRLEVQEECNTLRESVEKHMNIGDELAIKYSQLFLENQQLHQRLEKYQGALKKIAAKKGHALQRIDGEHCQQIAREALQRLKESDDG